MATTGSLPCALAPLFSSYHVWATGGLQSSNQSKAQGWTWLGVANSECFHCLITVERCSKEGGGLAVFGHGHRQHALPVAGAIHGAPQVGAAQGEAREAGQGAQVEVAVQPVRVCDGLTAAPLSTCSRALLPVEL